MPNSLNNEDATPPQSGRRHGSSTQSCTMIRGNFVRCFFGNPSNVDLANQTPAESPRNCFFGNTDPADLTSDPADQTVDRPACDQTGTGGSDALTTQLFCAAGLRPASYGSYPEQTRVTMLPLPP